jgi:hypothetical protein
VWEALELEETVKNLERGQVSSDWYQFSLSFLGFGFFSFSLFTCMLLGFETAIT